MLTVLCHACSCCSGRSRSRQQKPEAHSTYGRLPLRQQSLVVDAGVVVLILIIVVIVIVIVVVVIVAFVVDVDGVGSRGWGGVYSC